MPGTSYGGFGPRRKRVIFYSLVLDSLTFMTLRLEVHSDSLVDAPLGTARMHKQ